MKAQKISRKFVIRGSGSNRLSARVSLLRTVPPGDLNGLPAHWAPGLLAPQRLDGVSLDAHESLRQVPDRPSATVALPSTQQWTEEIRNVHENSNCSGRHSWSECLRRF